ncbi:MAG: hypothetical protein V4638_03415 [Bacteroidota bacterium]
MDLDNELIDFPVDKKRRSETISSLIVTFYFLNFFCLVVGFYLARIDIESIIFSGAALVLLSLILLILAIIQRKYFALPQAIIGLLIVAAIFLFIGLKELSPSEAKKPVPALLLIFLAIYFILFTLSLIREFRLPKQEK